jgi:serine/threonine protein phosphatase 1
MLHAKITQDATGFTGDLKVVYLGDYIDRGPQSREVVELLLTEPLQGFAQVHLLGNHEQAIMDFLQHPKTVAGWLSYGGKETMRSYGVDVPAFPGPGLVEQLRDELKERLPPRHLEFFQSLVHYHQAGDYLFVHAGIRPGVALQDQRNEDLLWIRDDFTESEEIHPQVVVFGHTIYPRVEFHQNRIGIDTGAFVSGVLTALVLEHDTQRLLQTGLSP